MVHVRTNSYEFYAAVVPRRSPPTVGDQAFDQDRRSISASPQPTERGGGAKHRRHQKTPHPPSARPTHANKAREGQSVVAPGPLQRDRLASLLLLLPVAVEVQEDRQTPSRPITRTKHRPPNLCSRTILRLKTSPPSFLLPPLWLSSTIPSTGPAQFSRSVPQKTRIIVITIITTSLRPAAMPQEVTSSSSRATIPVALLLPQSSKVRRSDKPASKP